MDPSVISEKLRTDGIAVVDAFEYLARPELLKTVGGPSCGVSAAKSFLRENKKYRPAFDLAEDPGIVEPLREYFGSKPRLDDSAVVYSFPIEGPAKQSQLWHRDPANDKLGLVFIYLTDVGLENGPFTYIKGTHSVGEFAKVEPPRIEDIKERHLRITDDEMRMVFPETEWMVNTGPKYTMIIADTIGWHKGPKVISGDRLVLRFVYRNK